MKRLTKEQLIETKGGAWEDRFMKQIGKCAKGNDRACRRARRIGGRHGIDVTF